MTNSIMNKYLFVLLFAMFVAGNLSAQDFKLAKTSGKLVLNLSRVEVEGYDGKEIIFSSTRSKEEEEDPRAKGLRAINGAGLVDNTGLGISVTENGTTAEVSQVLSDVYIKIRVPKGVIVSVAYHKVANSGTILCKNMENEIEISTDHNKIELQNVTGPVSVRALYGSVDAVFSPAVKGPVSIASIYSAVDVSVPGDIKANVNLSSQHGSILASADLKIEMEKNENSDMVSYGGAVNGKLNGGGAPFKLVADYGKIYLRKNK
ncbi:MAG: hypothetical protein QM726_11035 [Chitinophagaceae bacterium]